MAWLTGLWLLWASTAVWGQSSPPPPATGVAPTVLGILSYVRWSADVNVVNLCIVGPSEHTEELLRAQASEIAPRRHVQISRELADKLPGNCHVAYLGVLDDAASLPLLRRLSPQPLITIGERREQCQAGGMFCLDVQATSIAFEVNLDSLTRGGVRVHPNVLQLARRRVQTP